MQTRNSVRRVLAFVACESKCCVSDIKLIRITLGKNRPLFTFASIADAFLSKKQENAYKLC